MQTTIGFPQSLSERYRPRLIADFIGLDKPRKVLAKFVSNPFPTVFLFLGPSGVGKTSMALAVAEAMGAETHVIASQQCTVGEVEHVTRLCHYIPKNGKNSITF
jgi:replication-associated recombination protein RarA